MFIKSDSLSNSQRGRFTQTLFIFRFTSFHMLTHFERFKSFFPFSFIDVLILILNMNYVNKYVFVLCKIPFVNFLKGSFETSPLKFFSAIN